MSNCHCCCPQCCSQRCSQCCPRCRSRGNRRRRIRNQVRCYVFIASNNVPVRGAIVSCTFCDSGRVIFRRTDIFGTAVFNLPDGNFLFRCECVPIFLSPSNEDFCVTLNACVCEADLLFPATLLGTNAINQRPLANTQAILSNQQSIINNYSGLINNATSTPNNPQESSINIQTPIITQTSIKPNQYMDSEIIKTSQDYINSPGDIKSE
ncbi:MAG TPA: hypothetical protein GX745_03650 [Clostridiales bacterium]|nr:hypothetical protein [Clostridiales bacterium]